MYGLMPWGARDLWGEIATELTLITKPASAPLDLEQTKLQRRFTTTALDTLFDLWINAAVQFFQGETGTQLITATWEYWLDTFPWHRSIEIPMPPLQAVVSVKYDDSTGTEQTLDPATYVVRAPQREMATPGRLSLVSGATWPVTACEDKAVRIRFTAGYGDHADDVPDLIRYALMMLVGHFHKFGEEVNEARANILLLPIGATNVITDCKYMAAPQLPPPSHHGRDWGIPWR